MLVNGVEHSKIKDITNFVSGFLVAKQIHHITQNDGTYWLCVCTLDGNIRILKTSVILRKQFNSCGCLSSWRKKKGESGFNFLYSTYSQSAKRRKYEFKLTKDEFRKLITSNCFYCGSEPLNKFQLKGKYTALGSEHSSFIYNGIDRLSNRLGYILSNCVSCCKQCNIAKNVLDLNSYFIWLEQSYKHIKKLDLIPSKVTEFVV